MKIIALNEHRFGLRETFEGGDYTARGKMFQNINW